MAGPPFFVPMTDIKNIILKLAEPLVKAQGLEIWGLDFQEAGGNLVRLFVDVPLDRLLVQQGGDAGSNNPPLSASIDQCEEISRQLGLALEVEDCFKGPWTLEVSTPGLERKFYTPEQLKPYLGDMLEIRLREALPEQPGRKNYKGRLLSVGDADFVIDARQMDANGEFKSENLPPVTIPWDKARAVSRIHLFNVPSRPGKKGGKAR